MQTVYIFYSEIEAQMAQQYLAANEVHSHIIGAKEYATIVVGGFAGRYELKVDEHDLESAHRLLSKKLKLRPVHNEEPEADENPRLGNAKPNHFRKAVVYAFCAMCTLPIVFNFASLLNAKLFWQSSKNDADRAVKIIVIVALQVPGLIAGYILCEWLLNIFKGH